VCITRDTIADVMDTITIRELRNRGGEVIDRVAAGERLTVTRDGRPVAELRPIRRPGLPATLLIERWSRLPTVDPLRLRDDLDAILDQEL
jgi:prevent-host-death family protein